MVLTVTRKKAIKIIKSMISTHKSWKSMIKECLALGVHEISEIFV